MGARIPPNQRPRRGGIKCEFCDRSVPSEAALRSHQASLHSQALKEKAKQKLTVLKSKIQKSPVLKTYSNTAKKSPNENVSKTPETEVKDEAKQIADTSKPKTSTVKAETPKRGTESPILKPKISKQSTEASKSKTEAPKLKSAAAKSTTDTVQKTSKQTDMEAKSKKDVTAKIRKVEYKCPKCPKSFPVLFIAQKHIQKYHSNDEKVTPNTTLQPIEMELCIYCNDKFTKPHNCPNQPEASLLSYNCSGCQQHFKNNKLFDMHVADLHGYQSESLFFPIHKEFTTWKAEMESQTECEYILMGKYNSKEIYRCNEETQNASDDNVLLCPSTIIVKKCLKGFQINFYPVHYGHNFKKYDLKDQYKTFTVTELIHQAGYTNGNSEDDLYLQFKTFMESIVLDAAKINIATLKTLMSKASDMMTILQEYDEDDEEVETVNRSTISLNTSSSSLKEDSDSKSAEEAPKSSKRGTEENDEPPKKIQKTSDAKILVKSSTGKKSNTFSLADDKDSDKILKELDSDNVKANKERTSIQSPSFNDTYKDFIMNSSKTPSVTPKSTKTPSVTPNKKKNIVKTKIGQFKGPSPKKPVKRNSIAKDIEYEVREQEDDCNILVLKI